MASFAALIAFAGADAWRLHLMQRASRVDAPIGWLMFVAGWWVVYRALRANAFAVTVVRVQDERGHRVVRTGPYASCATRCTPASCPSWSAWGSGCTRRPPRSPRWCPTAILVARIVLEERVLRARLPEYAEYAASGALANAAGRVVKSLRATVAVARAQPSSRPARATAAPIARRPTSRIRSLSARSDTARDSIIAPTIDATIAST